MIREIISVEGRFLQIQLPEDFIGKLIEIIAFPIEEQAQQHTSQMKPISKHITVVAVNNKSFKGL